MFVASVHVASGVLGCRCGLTGPLSVDSSCCDGEQCYAS